MSWLDDIARRAAPPYVINDSKTPSGRAHVGALRGVLIHDSIFRRMSRLESSAKYTFGCDDYDALDELPHGLEDFYRPYLGAPLCNVPPPPGADASDIADFYISEFFALFEALDVAAKTYRMRDLYRSGQMDEVIDIVLRHRTKIREIYRRVNGSVKPEDWYPFQAICPNCGKIGTSIVTDYDGELVRFRCDPHVVSWARGCAEEGWASPFGGGGKLPWKLEWAARWKVLGVTIEGAGKDHTTRGGSRDVADAVAREVLEYQPPLNQPYEFFLVGGSKMSSSRGIGAAAADIARLLPPQVLRFLLIRTPAKKALNFTPDLESITRLYADYDRMLSDLEGPNPSEGAIELRYLSRIAGIEDESARVGWVLPWDTIVSLVQLSHVDFWNQAARRFDPPLTEQERWQLGQRVDSALFWLANYADADEKIELVEDSAQVVSILSNSQRAFLNIAGELLSSSEWNPADIQARLFDAARLTPVEQAMAFAALYQVFVGRPSGPKAGNFLAFLEKDDVVRRLRAVQYSRRLLMEESSIEAGEAAEYISSRVSDVEAVTVAPEFESIEIGDGAGGSSSYVDGLGVARMTLSTKQGRRYTVRVELSRFKGEVSTIQDERDAFEGFYADFLNELPRIVSARP